MDDTTAASAGFVLAGVALAASLLGWTGDGQVVPLVAAVLAGGALVAFALRRYGRLDRSAGAVAAAVASIGIVAAAIYAAFRGWTSPASAATALAGGGSAVLAYADWRGLGREALARRGGTTAIAVFVGALGLVAIVFWVVVIGFLVGFTAPGLIESSTGRTVLSTLATGAGTVSVVALYLVASSRDREYLDVKLPDLRGWAYAVGGVLAILGGNLLIGVLFSQFDVETTQHTIVQTAESDPTILLVLIPLSYLVIGPGEELLYRNVVQKSLREVFSPVAGVVIASAIFAAVHFSAYYDPSLGLLETMNTLVIIFALALILGAIYERTGNVVVAAIAHGTFNAVAFAATYWQLTGALGG